MAIALFFAAPKLEKLPQDAARLVTGLGLVVMLVLLVLPFRNLNWIHPAGEQIRWAKFFLIVAGSLIVVGFFGFWVCPAKQKELATTPKKKKS
jgi:hypothetical protein